MKISQCHWNSVHGWSQDPQDSVDAPQLVLAFGSGSAWTDHTWLRDLNRAHPRAHVVGCSTAGEICGTSVLDDSLVCTAVQFEHSGVEARSVELDEVGGSVEAGEHLAAALPHEGLVHVFVLSDGLQVNGSELVQGLTSGLPSDVVVTGGLAGDGDRFTQTFVVSGEGLQTGRITVLGFYGDRLRVGYGSLGGWDQFGPERLVTRSRGNVLFELDGRSALQLYREYLGDHAEGLPATGLRFPLAVRADTEERAVVRTILAIDENDDSMTFAGDLPEGSLARLMKANFDRLVDGAAGAARTTNMAVPEAEPELAILISCVGRKMVLRQRTEEEVEAVQDVLGEDVALTGFYSYGEISPFTPEAKCELHNQTMTITTFSEK